jgi:hypothetical protein
MFRETVAPMRVDGRRTDATEWRPSVSTSPGPPPIPSNDHQAVTSHEFRPSAQARHAQRGLGIVSSDHQLVV